MTWRVGFLLTMYTIEAERLNVMRKPGQKVLLYKDAYLQKLEDCSATLIKKKNELQYVEIWEVLLDSGEVTHRKLLKPELERIGL